MFIKKIAWLAFLCLISKPALTQEKGVTFHTDDQFIHSWNNLIKYSDKQDYLKNLDFAAMSQDKAPEEVRQFSEIMKLIADNKQTKAIGKIQEAINQGKESWKTIYLGLAVELLEDIGHYQAVGPFPQFAKKTSKYFAQFPAETQHEISHTELWRYGQTLFGQPTIEVNANGIKVHDAWMDSGAEVSHIARSLADQLGLQYSEEEKVIISTVNSKTIYAMPTFLDSLIIGNVLVKNHPIMVFEDENQVFGTDSVFVKVSLTLGWPLIRNLKVVLDGKQHQYQAHLSGKEESGYQNLFWLGFPGLKVNAPNGQSLIFGLDLGLSSSELKSNILKKVKLENISTETILVGGVGGNEKIEVQTVKNFECHLSGVKIHFDELIIRGNVDFYFIHQDGTIGSDVLKGNVVTINFKNGQFNLQPGDN